MIYLDNAATTCTDERVLQAMLPYFGETYSNPSSAYGFASAARRAVRKAREQVAALINASPDEIHFTSGGTESDNLAILGIAHASASKDKSNCSLISQLSEHPAVLNSLSRLENEGFEINLLKPDKYGYVSADLVSKQLKSSTVMVSVMSANNEISTVNDIAGIGSLCRSHGIVFHTDAVQAFGHIPIDVRTMNIDLLSASGHKFHGPKGVGILYIRNGIECKPQALGGGQEHGLRSGTENVPGIVGIGMAAELARLEMERDADRIIVLRNRLIERILNEVPDTILTGALPNSLNIESFASDSKDNRLPHGRLSSNASFAFKGIEGASLLIRLDMKGICASTGSACSASNKAPSHVLKAIGVGDEYINGSLRLSLSKYTTQEDIDYTADVIRDSVASLREIMK